MFPISKPPPKQKRPYTKKTKTVDVDVEPCDTEELNEAEESCIECDTPVETVEPCVECDAVCESDMSNGTKELCAECAASSQHVDVSEDDAKLLLTALFIRARVSDTAKTKLAAVLNALVM